jgi:hypothetical protein
MPSYACYMWQLEEICTVIIMHRHCRTIKKCRLSVIMAQVTMAIDGKWYVRVEMIIGYDKILFVYNMLWQESKLRWTNLWIDARIDDKSERKTWFSKKQKQKRRSMCIIDRTESCVIFNIDRIQSSTDHICNEMVRISRIMHVDNVLIINWR